MFKLIRFIIIAWTAIFTLSPLTATATCTPYVTEIVTKGPDTVNWPGNLFVGDFYGSGVEENKQKDYFFVIAPGAHPNGVTPTRTAAGAVYSYHKENGNWVQKQIINTSGTSDHLGGATVRSQGNWLFISAFGTPIGDSGTSFDQDFKGSVRIYKLNQNTGMWDLHQVLDSTTVPELADLSVRVFTDPPNGTNPGDPTKSDPSGALFGSTISADVDAGWMIVGAQGQNGTGPDNQVVKEAGAAYFFKLENGQWKFKQKVTRPDNLIERDNFAAVVETDGRWAFVSNADLQNHPNPSDPVHPRLTNANVWVYHRDGNQWHYVQQLSGLQPQSLSNQLGFYDAFGNAMSADDNWLIIAAPLDSTGGRAMGAAYVFKRENNVWNIKQTIQSDEAFNSAAPGHMLGFLNGVRIKDNTAVIGDPGHSGAAPGVIRQGALLIYKRDGNVWNKVLTAFDPNGAANDFFGVGATLTSEHILGGTLTAIDFGYPNFVPPHRAPPTATGKAVLFKRNCF